jgi:hypothetical protein
MRSIGFEPDLAGGGSLWEDDDLLAVLTVVKQPDRRGRFSLRGTNRAFDTFTMIRHSRKQHTSYQLVSGLRRLADAQGVADELTVALRYRGQEFVATRQSLSTARDDRQIVALAPPLDWHARQMNLCVEPGADLPLVAFYLFVAYDLSSTQSTGTGIAL